MILAASSTPFCSNCCSRIQLGSASVTWRCNLRYSQKKRPTARKTSTPLVQSTVTSSTTFHPPKVNYGHLLSIARWWRPAGRIRWPSVTFHVTSFSPGSCRSTRSWNKRSVSSSTLSPMMRSSLPHKVFFLKWLWYYFEINSIIYRFLFCNSRVKTTTN